MKLKFLNLTNLFVLASVLIAFFFISNVISPYLYYSYQQIGFVSGIEFFRSYSHYSGGIADYTANFLSQFFYTNYLGSFVIVAVAAMLGLIAINVVHRLIGKTGLHYSVFASVFLFGVLVMCDYRYPYYASIRLLFAYLFVIAFQAVNKRSWQLSVLFWPAMAFLLFYLAGGSALLVFSLSTAIIFGITNTERIRYFMIAAFLFLGGILPYIGYKFLFPLTLRNSYAITMVKPPMQFAYSEGYPIYVYYILLPLILFISLLFIQLKRPEPIVPPTAKLKKGEKGNPKIRFYKKEQFLIPTQFIVLGVLAYFMVGKLHDTFKKQIIYIDYLAENRRFTDVLKEAEKLELYDFRVNFQVNRAYANLGQLSERLFAFPQRLGSYGLFFDPSQVIGSTDMPSSDLYFDLGFMDEAQHMAFEAETLIPHSPRILKRLVMINIVNRKYQVAEKFLKILDKNWLYEDWVDQYEKYLIDTTLAANDPVIAEKRRFTPKKVVKAVEPNLGLKLLLETNMDNRMAYDYLLANAMLDSRLTEFVAYLKLYTHYKLKKLPKSWEEALAMSILRTRTFPDFYTDGIISESCMKRLTAFNQIMKKHKNDLPSARPELERDFSDTYWFYTLYLSPRVTNVFESKSEVR